MLKLWQSGDSVALRGMYNGRPWYIQSARVVSDSPRETALLVEPGAECIMPSGYIHKKHGGHTGWDRWGEILSPEWSLEKFTWHTNRFLILLEPGKFYASIYMWEQASGEFLCYYINFQLPFVRGPLGFDTFDLELDIVIDPDFQWHWKDQVEYEQGILAGVIRPEWVRGIEAAKPDVFERIEKRLYPLDGRWRNWLPDPSWEPPRLPEGWDK